MKIASAQYPISKHADLNAWKKHTQQWVKNAVEQQADVLLFPEYGSMELVSIFPETVQQDIHLQIAEMQSLLPDFMETYQALAALHQKIIVAPSFPVKVNSDYYNRVYVFDGNGLVGYQDKLFMTRFEKEEWNIQSGPKKLTVFETKRCKFGIQICYDSEFSIGSHILADNGVNLLLVPSCTETIRGATRVHVGTRARAMEQQQYAVVSQTVGMAEWSPSVDINYGYAGFYATPDKHFQEEGIIQLGTPQVEEWIYSSLDFSLIDEVRKDGQVFNYNDHREINSLFKNDTFIVEIATTNL
jgi:predicted amidohydrolase